MKFSIFALIFMSLIGVFLAQEEKETDRSAKNINIHYWEKGNAKENAVDKRNERFFGKIGKYTTTTRVILYTNTKTLIVTCMTTTGSNNCKRRKRRSMLNGDVNEGESFDQLLSSTMQETEDPDFGIVPVRANERQGRHITIWSTASSTITVQIHSFLPTTVTATAICNTLDGVSFANSCFGG